MKAIPDGRYSGPWFEKWLQQTHPKNSQASSNQEPIIRTFFLQKIWGKQGGKKIPIKIGEMGIFRGKSFFLISFLSDSMAILIL
jgi:hypothetical protein